MIRGTARSPTSQRQTTRVIKAPTRIGCLILEGGSIALTPKVKGTALAPFMSHIDLEFMLYPRRHRLDFFVFYSKFAIVQLKSSSSSKPNFSYKIVISPSLNFRFSILLNLQWTSSCHGPSWHLMKKLIEYLLLYRIYSISGL